MTAIMYMAPYMGLPKMDTIGILTGHAIFAMVVALVYNALVA